MCLGLYRLVFVIIILLIFNITRQELKASSILNLQVICVTIVFFLFVSYAHVKKDGHNGNQNYENVRLIMKSAFTIRLMTG